ncbi:hypothetical protein [Neobacillus massiliamazoniensis]|uniref:Uncharacterized protein n=1 Tax=Neobacillus massiliamazoniensis TaxID=1499688 RepID=A0A0U1NRD8_9BACI|nr:hypothetical protein [Neobacillus massiliamazoniensis]CRK80609.1 hypothetical protein BN000_00497 [Neobacillus massiliamazoniensis]
MKSFFLLKVILLGSFIGYQKDLSKLETKPNIILIEQPITESAVAIPNNNIASQEIPSLFVHHQTRGNDVFVECILTGISFRQYDHSKEKVGKVLVSIDGKKKQEVTTAAFIIKGISPGNHKLKLEVVNLKNEPYGLEKEFLVDIPK